MPKKQNFELREGQPSDVKSITEQANKAINCVKDIILPILTTTIGRVWLQIGYNISFMVIPNDYVRKLLSQIIFMKLLILFIFVPMWQMEQKRHRSIANAICKSVLHILGNSLTEKISV